MRVLFTLFLATLPFASGCERSTEERSTDTAAQPATSPTQGPAADKPRRNPERRAKSQDFDFENYIETGDLKALEKRGTIRFVGLAADEDDMLPRKTIVTQRHFDLALELANRLGLEAHWIQATSPAKALQILREGKADVLAGNLTSTEQRQQQFDLTEPILRTRQQLVTGKNGPGIKDIADLKDKTLWVLADSTFADTAKKLAQEIPGLTVTYSELKPSGNLDTFIDRLNAQKNSVSIFDSNTLNTAREYRQDIVGGAFVSGEEDIVWAMRKDSPDLQLSINNFFTGKLVKLHGDRTVRGSSWADIKKHRVLRLVTYNGPTSYYMWKGVLMGFDYDLAMKFAKKHNLELEIVVAPYGESLIDRLKENKGDIAGAASTITDERIQEGIAFSAPYLEVPEQILSNNKTPKIESLQDLNGKTVTVRAYSSFIETAKKLQNSGIQLKLEIADPTISYAQLINLVASGEVAMTIVDANAAEIAASLHDTLVAGIIVTKPRPQGWMVAAENKELLEKISAFIREYRGTDDYVKKVATYFKPNEKFTKRMAARVRPGEDLSPYDKLVKEVAQKYQLDWRLVTAQMWQESSFDPKAESSVGAQGLLQVMPRTAQEMGYPPPLFEPRRAIRAGVKYLNWIRNRFDTDVSLENRLWFSLAAYNAGIGHVYDAQRLARELGLDPNVWFGHVEKAMLKLSEPRYYHKARYGYARGAEPVEYVRNISTLYQAYTDVSSSDVTAQPVSPLQQTASTQRNPPLAVFCSPHDTTPSIGALLKLIASDEWPRNPVRLCVRQSLAAGNNDDTLPPPVPIPRFSPTTDTSESTAAAKNKAVLTIVRSRISRSPDLTLR